MTEQCHSLVDCLNDCNHVLSLPFQFVLGGVTALAATPTLNRVDRVVISERRTDVTLLPELVNVSISAYEYKRWTIPVRSNAISTPSAAVTVSISLPASGGVASAIGWFTLFIYEIQSHRFIS